jgi:hypothetical protein
MGAADEMRQPHLPPSIWQGVPSIGLARARAATTQAQKDGRRLGAKVAL